MAGLAQHGEIRGTFDEFIVVGITTENRIWELTTPTADDRYTTMPRGLDSLLSALRSPAAGALRRVHVDRRDSEHHGSIYHLAALDALRTLYPQPWRPGSPLPWLHIAEMPELSEAAQADKAIPCTTARSGAGPARAFRQLGVTGAAGHVCAWPSPPLASAGPAIPSRPMMSGKREAPEGVLGCADRA